MLLTSGPYFVFLIVVFFAYWLIAERRQWRIAFLVGAGYFFYAQAGITPLLLLLAISTVDFTTTRLMGKCESGGKRKWLLSISLLADIGTLCVFKYANFFLESATNGLSFLGIHAHAGRLNLLVPLGISFFVFQSVAYVVDVYRKDTPPAQSFLEYLAFISFFPTMVAGPILRARQFLPQLRNRVTLDAETGGQALFLIAVGLIKKIAIADYLSTNFVDRVFDFPERFSSLEVLTAVYGYALQIYADFSGYSDIAIGSALLLGLTLPVNFDTPYRSRDLPEFWRRWHISLSAWLRDYVFFSVVGRRARNTGILYCGLVVTMLVGGLWHGAMWTFVLWGLLHGIGLVAVRAFETLRKRWNFAPGNVAWSQALGVFLTFHFVCAAWIFFRAETVRQAGGVFRQLARFTADTTNLSLPILFIIALGYAAHWIPKDAWNSLRKGFVELPAVGQAAVLFGLALGLYSVAGSDVMPFIYARF